MNPFSPEKRFGRNVNAKHSLSSSQNPKGAGVSLSELHSSYTRPQSEVRARKVSG